MGKKAEAGTPKALANAMKSKGLQKLRFFCQLCQKQCRDENGFKCHTMSEGHQRQMLLCATNPGHLHKVTSEFSSDFLGSFLQILRRQYGGKRVSANRVYQEYIADKNHTHMNATRWHTLSGFVQWLGKTGYAKVDYVEEKNQWYLEYVDNSPETLQRKAEVEKLKKSRKDDAERETVNIQDMINKGKDRADKKGLEKEETTFTELIRSEDDAPIKVTLTSTKLVVAEPVQLVAANPLANLRKQAIEKSFLPNPFKKPAKKSAMEQIRIMEDREKRLKRAKMEPLIQAGIEAGIKREADIKQEADAKRVKMEPDVKPELKWIHKNITVKIRNKKLGEKFYKQKGFIESTDGFTAVVQVIESRKRAKIDQSELETVIPTVGREVVVLIGERRGMVGKLVRIESEKFQVAVEVDGETLTLPYEQISKLYQTKS